MDCYAVPKHKFSSIYYSATGNSCISAVMDGYWFSLS